MDPVRAIADAVLYEGYILWPYRRSAMKNRQRWTFGGVYPRGHSEGREDDPWLMQTQCLLEAAGDARLDVSVRFLQVVERRVCKRAGSGLEPVDELVVDGHRHLSWEEAVEREIAVTGSRLDDLGDGHREPIEFSAGSEIEDLFGANGDSEGAIVRSCETLEGAVAVRAQRLASRLHRITVTIANTTPWETGPRERALKRTFCSTHTVLRVSPGRFVSLTNPPEGLRAAAEECRNEGTWPVLAGEGETMLSSPIILEDHPQVAPESPGDLFDGSEIDQMLVLNILSLTEGEKAEMRDTDPRAREILARTEALSEEDLMRLHGAIREFGLARGR